MLQVYHMLQNGVSSDKIYGPIWQRYRQAILRMQKRYIASYRLRIIEDV